METEKKRRLVAIMFADVAGYTAIMQRKFYRWSVYCYFLCAFLSMSKVQAQMNQCAIDTSQQMFMYIQPKTEFKDYYLLNKFKKPIHYETKKVNGRRAKLYFAEARNDIPINIYYNKRSKFIFMIEVIAEDAKEQFILRDFLRRNGTDLGNFNCFLGKYRSLLEEELQPQLGSGDESIKINKKYLDYDLNFGKISFLVSRDSRNKEWIMGVRILFNNDL